MVYINERWKHNNITDKESCSKNKNDYIKNFENIVYRDVKGRLCAATPAAVIHNRTPPSPSQKHHFPQKHQINFCNDENHHAPSRRESADVMTNLNFIHYGTSNCKPEKSSGI